MAINPKWEIQVNFTWTAYLTEMSPNVTELELVANPFHRIYLVQFGAGFGGNILGEGFSSPVSWDFWQTVNLHKLCIMPLLHLQSVVVVGGAGLAGKCHNFSSRSGMEEVVRGAQGDKRMEGKKQSTNIAVVAYFRRIQNFGRLLAWLDSWTSWRMIFLGVSQSRKKVIT